MTTTAPPQIQFLYIVNSGNNDGVYKIGISNDPAKRLKQIRTQYNVPRAFLVETMDVATRDEVFTIESALHDKYESQAAAGYEGREWFVLSHSDLEDLKAMYRSESNDFQQCTAFFGLVEAKDSIALQADEAEMERQSQIRHNRVHGLKYDTKPTGVLKRYNDLQKKIRTSTLGERFTQRTYKHPAVGLQSHIVTNLVSIAESRLKSVTRNLAAAGFLGGLTLAGLSGSLSPGAVAVMGGVTGLISGVCTQSSRLENERQDASRDANEYIQSAYPNSMTATQLVVLDERKQIEYLVRDYKESSSNLRDVRPVRPVIERHVPIGLTKKFVAKNYFPITGSIVTGVICLAAISGTLPPPEMEERISLAPAPVVQLR